MKVSGNLTGLTPKEKADGQVIEIKITIPFDSQDLAKLGGVFGLAVVAEITEQQGQLFKEEER